MPKGRSPGDCFPEVTNLSHCHLWPHSLASGVFAFLATAEPFFLDSFLSQSYPLNPRGSQFLGL